MNKLHKSEKENSPSDSTIAYQVTYFPWSRLHPQAKREVAWNRTVVFTKQELLESLDEDRVLIYLPKSNSQFYVVWEFNNVPTKQQWDELEPDQLVRVQFRISGLADYCGRVAILSIVGFGMDQLQGERKRYL